jgi:hypothetical protein
MDRMAVKEGGEKSGVNRRAPGGEVLLKIVRGVHRRVRPSLSSSSTAVATSAVELIGAETAGPA